MADVLRRLGTRVRELREARGLTQEALGERAGISWHYVSSIERARKGATTETLAALAAALDLTLSELFLGVDRPLPREAKRLATLLAGNSPETQRRVLRIVEEAIQLAKGRDVDSTD
jgi:transcriptional regulator with XRE-family HTH domain